MNSSRRVIYDSPKPNKSFEILVVYITQYNFGFHLTAGTCILVGFLEFQRFIAIIKKSAYKSAPGETKLVMPSQAKRLMMFSVRGCSGQESASRKQQLDYSLFDSIL